MVIERTLLKALRRILSSRKIYSVLKLNELHFMPHPHFSQPSHVHSVLSRKTHLIAHPQSGQIGRTTLGDTGYENSLVIALEWCRTLTARYAQPQPGGCAFNVNFRPFLLELGESVQGICKKRKTKRQESVTIKFPIQEQQQQSIEVKSSVGTYLHL